MKKVLFMLSRMNAGGVEKSFLSLLTQFPKDRYDITLVLLEKRGVFLQLVPNWVKIEEAAWFDDIKPVIMQPPQQTIKHYMKSGQFLRMMSFTYGYFLAKKRNDRSLYYQQVFKKVPEYKNSFDLAVAYQGPTEVIDYYVAHKVRATAKVSWIHFDVSRHVINDRLFAGLYDQFHRIHVVSEHAKHQLVERFPHIKGKTNVFHNVISSETIQDLAEKTVVFDDSYPGVKIVTVGRLSFEKGQDLAIKALAELRRIGYEARWYCIGDGQQRKTYEQLIEAFGLEDDFILLGSIMNPYPFIKHADVYVQPSRHEGYCLTLAEARCLNKPIVATNFNGVRDQISHGNNGWIAENTSESLVAGIQAVLGDANMTAEFIRRLSEELPDHTEEIQERLYDMEQMVNV
ncbi:putative glycosyltransferase [Lentibacillus sp. JNUCC-1]|uniref:glycosyltransferase n=1 Tax=Lentibacillus sp. JNUCC-1 TaxID=2654513 RepID=UPI0012E731A8|nr:glycosyltransferase [Lentibacillus sp. JNUCC-1]MUV36900.1 putative glycosyltransferase [Lentibacillus sp. JNUCC-1]